MSAVRLTTPSLGVRVSVVGPKIVFRLGNEGGRGLPSHMLLLPVSDVDPMRMKCPFGWNDARLGNDQKVDAWNVYCASLTNKLPGPFTEVMLVTQWRAQLQDGPMLVVLSFGNPRAEGDMLSSDAREELDRLLNDQNKAAWRRRGVVLLPQSIAASNPPLPKSPNGSPGKPGSGSPTPAPPPEPQRSSIVFVLASCQYPAGIVDGTPQDFVAFRNAQETPRGPADASLLRLHDRLVTATPAQRPSLLLLSGDQVYVDATAGLFDARAVVTVGAGSADIEEDWLRVPYHNWLGSVGAQSVFGLLGTRMMIDDHEIGDNWERRVGGLRSKANDALNRLRAAGAKAYGLYQSAVDASPPFWDASFSHGAIRFFLADTRTKRDPRSAASEFRKPLPANGAEPPSSKPPRIMDPDQHRALETWLDQDADRPAFILSPSIFLPRRLTSRRTLSGALHSDAWDGYPSSLEGVLACICRTRRRRLVFLSGDEHVSCVVQATVRACLDDVTLGEPVVLHSIHSSALYAPYPFANAVPEEFASREHWCFDDPSDPSARYRCDVEVLRWVPGDGYACLHLHRDGDGHQPWRLDVEFDREDRDGEIVELTL